MNGTTTFGEWLRQRRKALDLTQDVLANRAGCSPETIRKIETGKRRPSREMVEALAQRLAVPPEERAALVEFARVGADVPSLDLPLAYRKESRSASAPAESKTNLPRPVTTFVGRDREIEAVRTGLGRVDARLLTLTGTGVSGKTRLAIQVASEARQDFQDGVFFVSLAAITEPKLVAAAIARTPGVHEAPGQSLTESIIAYSP